MIELAHLRALLERATAVIPFGSPDAFTSCRDREIATEIMLPHLPALLDELERLRQEDEEWSQLCNQQHAMLEEMTSWPPTSIACGWCVRAAGDDDAARKTAKAYTLDEVRAHANVCPHNPAVVERDALHERLALVAPVVEAAKAFLASLKRSGGDFTNDVALMQDMLFLRVDRVLEMERIDAEAGGEK